MSRIPAGPAGDPIRRGKAIADATKQHLPNNVGNGLRCTNCHLGSGTVANAAAWVGVLDRYPQYRPRSGGMETIEGRINDCFERSMNGVALQPTDEAMTDLIAWMGFLSQGVDGKALAPDTQIPLMKTTRPPDLVHGKVVYDARCLACHGADGHGVTAPDGTVVFPALGGDGSFNIAAGMARQRTAAGFIQKNMPMGQEGSLSDDDAWDVAGWVIALDRPDFTLKHLDWPKGGKPDDARY